MRNSVTTKCVRREQRWAVRRERGNACEADRLTPADQLGALSWRQLVITGPGDYMLLTSSDVVETISRAADRVEQDKWVRAFGLERFAGCIRRRVFETGALLANEDALLSSLYIIMDGECRASVRCTSAGTRTPKKTTAEVRTTSPYPCAAGESSYSASPRHNY